VKTFIIVLVTAAACFGIAAATGLARGDGRQYDLKVGDRSVFAPDDVQCQVLAKTQVVCASLKVAKAVAVYYSPTQLAVVQVTSNNKGKLLYEVKR